METLELGCSISFWNYPAVGGRFKLSHFSGRVVWGTAWFGQHRPNLVRQVANQTSARRAARETVLRNLSSWALLGLATYLSVGFFWVLLGWHWTKSQLKNNYDPGPEKKSDPPWSLSGSFGPLVSWPSPSLSSPVLRILSIPDHPSNFKLTLYCRSPTATLNKPQTNPK